MGMSETPTIPSAERGAYPRREGNAVRPLVDGAAAFARIAAAVESARARVWVRVEGELPEHEAGTV